MEFLAELRRRNVFRVGGVYVVGAWLVMQVVAIGAPAMGLPDWADGLVLLLLIVGFFVALVLAWALELTPEGVRASSPAPQNVPESAPAKRLAVADVVIAVALVAVLGVSVFQASVPRLAEVGGSPTARPSIAVLPFADMSPQRDQEYFADGLSEELMNHLAHIEDLRVAGRTSSFAFKGQSPRFQEIRDALGVATVLEGSVRKDGDRLRITAQLVNAQDGYHRWSETYDRQLDDIFAIQEEIAVSVANALSVTLGLRAQGSGLRAQESYPGGSGSVEAYDHYLRGVTAMAQISPDAARRATDEFREAVAIDPDFARAWIGLAQALGYLRNMFLTEADRIAPERAAAIERALELAPELPGVQMAKALMHVDRREWLDAYRACEHVFAGPTDAEAMGLCAEVFSEIGAPREGLPHFEAWTRADPLSGAASLTLLRQYTVLSMKDAYLREEERARPLLVDLSFGFRTYELLQLLSEDAPGDAVLAMTDRWCPPIAALSAFVDCPTYNAAIESPAEAATLLRAELGELRESSPGDAMLVAWFAAYLDEDELALDAIEVFYPTGAGWNLQTLWAPLFADVRRLPGFKIFVDEAGYLEVWRETGDWGDFCRPLGEDNFECS